MVPIPWCNASKLAGSEFGDPWTLYNRHENAFECIIVRALGDRNRISTCKLGGKLIFRKKYHILPEHHNFTCWTLIIFLWDHTNTLFIHTVHVARPENERHFFYCSSRSTVLITRLKNYGRQITLTTMTRRFVYFDEVVKKWPKKCAMMSSSLFEPLF